MNVEFLTKHNSATSMIEALLSMNVDEARKWAVDIAQIVGALATAAAAIIALYLARRDTTERIDFQIYAVTSDGTVDPLGLGLRFVGGGAMPVTIDSVRWEIWPRRRFAYFRQQPEPGRANMPLPLLEPFTVHYGEVAFRGAMPSLLRKQVDDPAWFNKLGIRKRGAFTALRLRVVAVSTTGRRFPARSHGHALWHLFQSLDSKAKPPVP